MAEATHPEIAARVIPSILAGQMLCAGRVANLLHYALQSASVPGDVVEFGCFRGLTACLLASMVPKQLWLYDSFEGLPQPTDEDQSPSPLRAGAMKASMEDVRKNFDSFGLPQPIIMPKWFWHLVADELPDRIAFAHLDCDLYESMKESLSLVYPRMYEGGVIVIDDYGHWRFPGVKRAVDGFCAAHGIVARALPTGNPDGCQAVIQLSS